MVDMPAPDPVTPPSTSALIVTKPQAPLDNPSVVKVTIAGCGGCGINLSRPFAEGKSEAQVLYFDTSIANSRYGESVNVLSKEGNGSGSHRSENARDIEREVAALTEEHLGVADVAIVVFSLAGGSGSVIGPLMAREYARRAGMRVICVVVADTGSSTEAKNTINTLKTLTAIATNGGLYLPLVVLSNDSAGRRPADEAALLLINDLVEILTKPVYEVDRNDRLNWVNPAKVVGAKPGIKLLSLTSDRSPSDEKIVIGLNSEEMVDSTLIIENADGGQRVMKNGLPLTRLKKVGFYYKDDRQIVGTVSGDIKAIDSVIDFVERVQQLDKSQRYDQVDRLASSGSEDIIL